MKNKKSKTNVKYWEDREVQKLKGQLKDLNKLEKLLKREYERASKEINKNIMHLFIKYMEDNELTYAQANQLLTSNEYKEWRMDLKDLCVYKEVPRQWMKQLLQAARLAPSSMNSQPWRFVVYDNRIHVFAKKHNMNHLGKFEELNFGIMFSHLMVVAEELWLDVDLIRLEDITHKNFPNNQYVLSAILRT